MQYRKFQLKSVGGEGGIFQEIVSFFPFFFFTIVYVHGASGWHEFYGGSLTVETIHSVDDLISCHSSLGRAIALGAMAATTPLPPPPPPP